MKKLMIATAIVCAAAFANAAKVQWKTSEMYAPSDANGTYGSVSIADGGTFSLYSIDSSLYNAWMTGFADDGVAATSKDIYDTVSEMEAIVTGSSSAKGKFTITDTRDVSTATDTKPIDLYSAIIFSYTDGDGKEWYVANVGTLHFEANVNGSLASLDSLAGGTGGTVSLTAWQTEAVPEPFSGALALLGMGAIALRRKMKKAKKA